MLKHAFLRFYLSFPRKLCVPASRYSTPRGISLLLLLLYYYSMCPGLIKIEQSAKKKK